MVVNSILKFVYYQDRTVVLLTISAANLNDVYDVREGCLGATVKTTVHLFNTVFTNNTEQNQH